MIGSRVRGRSAALHHRLSFAGGANTVATARRRGALETTKTNSISTVGSNASIVSRRCRHHHQHHHPYRLHRLSTAATASQRQVAIGINSQIQQQQQQQGLISMRTSRSSSITSSAGTGNGNGGGSSSPEALANEIAKYYTSAASRASSTETAAHIQPGAGGGTAIWTALAKQLSPDTQRQVMKDLQTTGVVGTTTVAPAAGAAVTTVGGGGGGEKMAVVVEPSYKDLKAIAFTTSVPFVGFGFMDNAILIIAGDAIDTSLGVILNISTMCAAAIGNTISDVAGIMMGTAIEDFCAKYMKLPTPNLTTAQRQLRSVRFASQFGCAVGIVIGCIIGMCPLLYIDSNKIQAKKREAHLDSMFKDIITEAGSLIGAQMITMFTLVHKPEDGSTTPLPTTDGKYLYAKYEADSKPKTKNQQGSQPHVNLADRYIPLGRGIISRAALTGQSWNIYDVRSEPDYSPELVLGVENEDAEHHIKNMVCVPVLDAHGRAIAVLQAINKVSKGSGDDNIADGIEADGMTRRGFSTSDVHILKALASHISVTLQRMYDEEGDDMRLKDTITMLKDYKLEGLALEQSNEGRKLLFPMD